MRSGTLGDAVAALAARPDALARRLDLADALQRAGRGALARWMRLSLAQGVALDALGATFPTRCVWGGVRFSSLVAPNDPFPGARLQAWERVCPEYWRSPVHCDIGEYYGRWVVTASTASHPPAREDVDELAGMDWLEDLAGDGLLEMVELDLGGPETADWVRALPERFRRLPFSLCTARAYGGTLSAATSRELLSWPSLQGLYLTSETFAPGCVALLPALAPSLRTLTIEASRRSAERDALFADMAAFPQLRLLSVLGTQRLTDDDLAGIARSASLAAVGLHSVHLERDGLFAVGAAPGLRWLGINSGRLTRGDIAAFRSAFPHVDLLLSYDLLARLGPV